jgi:hypothetical protein
MFTKKLLISALLAVGTIGAAAMPLTSAADTRIELGYGAPAQYQYEPAQRPGHVWVPGYRAWDGYRRVWVPGHWERMHGYNGSDYGQRGYAYANPRWDRDGDGVPNRYDARPDNPYRY